MKLIRNSLKRVLTLILLVTVQYLLWKPHISSIEGSWSFSYCWVFIICTIGLVTSISAMVFSIACLKDILKYTYFFCCQIEKLLWFHAGKIRLLSLFSLKKEWINRWINRSFQYFTWLFTETPKSKMVPKRWGSHRETWSKCYCLLEEVYQRSAWKLTTPEGNTEQKVRSCQVILYYIRKSWISL